MTVPPVVLTRQEVRLFAAWARFVHRFRWPVLLASGLLMAASIVVVAQGGTLKSGGIIETSESGRALDLLQEELPRASGSSFFLIFESDRLKVEDREFRSALESALAAVRSDARVEAVRTPYDTTPPIPSFVSRDGSKAYAVVSVKDDITGAARYYDELRAKISSDTLRITASGNIAITEDFNEILESDLQRAEIVSLPLALVLLLIVFGTVVAALLPLGVGVLSVLAGVAGTFLLANVTDVSQYALNVVTLIGLGVAIDYSLFIVNRFREELRRTGDVERALGRGLSTAGRAVLFSGLTVAIGLSGMLFYEGTFLSSMGLAGSIVVAFAVVYALTFLPALLSLLGPRVNVWRVPIGGGGGEGAGFWHALATRVMRRPLVVLLPLLVVIGFTASPFLRLHLANGDVSMLPRHVESRRGYDLLVNEFPGQETTQVTVVVRYADGAPLSRERIPALVEYVRRLEALPDVLRVDSVFGLDTRAFSSPPGAPAQPARPLSVAEYQALYGQPREQLPQPLQVALRQAVGEHIVTVSVVTTKDKKSADAQALVRRIRAEAPPPGAETLVTGLTAFDIDVVQFIVDRSPYAIGWVMLATYVVLFLLLGSVVLPLKAVLMNLISISTSFGALVWIFQEGNLAPLLGGFTPGPLDPTLPVIMFCSVFGLSMDYEVLLLSRIQEQYRRSADNTRAVAQGLESSGRLITGAAAIMVGVFLAFSLAEVVIIKALGFGMALAVAIDATIVRALVVPATMRLLGRANWWAPGPLARLYDRLRLGESPRPAVTASTEAD